MKLGDGDGDDDDDDDDSDAESEYSALLSILSRAIMVRYVNMYYYDIVFIYIFNNIKNNLKAFALVIYQIKTPSHTYSMTVLTRSAASASASISASRVHSITDRDRRYNARCNVRDGGSSAPPFAANTASRIVTRSASKPNQIQRDAINIRFF